MLFQNIVAVLVLVCMIDEGQGQTTPPMVVPPLLTTPLTRLTNCNGSQFDLVFVLDSSGSVGEDNFKIIKSFVKSVVQNLNVGPDDTRVGIITFSRYPVIRLHLDDYTDKDTLLKAIDTVPYIAGITETHSALYLLKDEGFRGSRPNVPNIAIVVTDGKSFHTNLTASAANDLQNQGVVMFGIGIGGDVNLPELTSIASSPEQEYVYTVTNFQSLSSIVNSLSSRTCDVTTVGNITTPQPVSTQQPTYINTTTNGTQGECNLTVADIVFVLDSSGSLGITNFAKVKQFVINIVNYLDIGVNYTKVGVITYSNYPTRRLNLDSYTNKLDLVNAINQIPYYPGNTETDKAIDLLRLEGFEGERKDAPNIAIVVTDGLSTNPDLTKIAASRLKKTGTTVFSIGIGQDVIDRNELNYISSDPDSDYVFFVANFSDLSSIENSVAKTTCLVPLLTTTIRTIPPTPVSTVWVTPSTMKPTVTLAPSTLSTTLTTETTTQPCTAKVADVVFVVDSSGSVGEENFLKIKQFMKQTIKVFDIGTGFTRIGVITFSTNAKLEFQLNTYNNSQDVLQAVDNIVYTQGGTNTGEALELLRLKGFNYERTNDPNIAIVITDGYSRDKVATRQQALLAKQNSNVTIIAIGVGNGTDVDELRAIATVDSNSKQSLVYEVGDFEALQTLNNVVATVACGLVVVTPTPEATTPSTTVALGNCTDAVENCEEYGDDICYDYKPWAMAHCQRHCGFCAGPATTPEPCQNRLNNCPEYGTYICTSVSLTRWTNHNCPKYCGFCGGGPIPTEPTTTVAVGTTGAPKCGNLLSNCDEYGGTSMCHKQSYEAWAKSHCAEFCGYCSNYVPHKGPTLQNNVTCPDWNLPLECTMEQSDGSCCPMPKCPQGYKLTAKSPLEF